MANDRVLDQIEKLELGIAADDARDPADIHKFPAWLRTLYVTRLAAVNKALKNSKRGVSFRVGASGRLRAALDRLDELHRDGFNFIKGILSSKISAADRLMVFTAYGWTSGEIGIFTDPRREQMARQAIDAVDIVANPAYRYPTTDLLDPIIAQLAIVNANQPAATGGESQSLNALLEIATDDAEACTERGRLYICACSDLRERNPELTKYGFQAKRESGDATPPPKSDKPATPTYNPATQELTIPEMPAHATSIRAKRQPLGGTAEVAGLSLTTTVSVVQFTPLTPGVTYEFWVVGVNAEGEGPESNHVTHAVPNSP